MTIISSPRLFRKLHAFCWLSIIALLAGAISAQATPTWAESYGTGSYGTDGKTTDDPFYGSGYDFPVAVAPMPDGGMVVAGQVDLPRLYRDLFSSHTSAASDGALVRFAADGTILWQITLHETLGFYNGPYFNPAPSHIVQMQTDAQGNIFILGGKGNPSNGGQLPFVAKFSPEGQLVWHRCITGSTEVSEEDPPQVYDTSISAPDKMGLTNDGGVVIMATTAYLYGGGYTSGFKPIIAKFDNTGALSFFKTYDIGEYYAATGPICQTADGSKYVAIIRHNIGADNSTPGLVALVVDASTGGIVGQHGWPVLGGGNEFPLSLIRAGDGSLVLLSVKDDGYNLVLRKFNADASAEVFERSISSPSGVAAFWPGSLAETADGGFLIGGHTSVPFSGFAEDAALMKVSGDGTLQFVSVIGGPAQEGAGSYSNGPTGAVATYLSDGGYGLATISTSFYTGVTSTKPDWWIVKADANRHVRNFTGEMADIPPGNFTVSGTTQAPSDYTYLTRTLNFSGKTTAATDFVIQDLRAFVPPDRPNFVIQASGPRIISSQNVEAVVQQHFAYQIITAFFPDPSLVTFSATGLPSGFAINQNSGIIRGVPAAGSETATPIAITLHATDGVDTADAVLNLTIGDGEPVLSVNGSDQPAPNLADTALAFAVRYPGKLAGRLVMIQTAPAPSGPWSDLDTGLAGAMTYDYRSQTYLLSSTNYPQQNGIYFRARVKADGFFVAASNVVGPFDLASGVARAGKTVFELKRNGLRADFDFRATQIGGAAGVSLRVQSTKTPASESSWTDLKDGGGNLIPAMSSDGDATHFALLLKSLPRARGVYFRAVAHGPDGSGIIDSISNMIGSYAIEPSKPPTVSITSPPSGGAGQSFDNPLVIQANSNGIAEINIHATATAGNGRSISKFSVLFDGQPVYTVPGNSASASIDYQKNTSVAGDHVIEALAFDDLNMTARAGTGPLYIRIAPTVPSAALVRAKGSTSNVNASSLAGKVYHVVNSGGYWHDPATWQDAQGNSGVPGPNDVAVVGAATVNFSDPNFEGFTVGSLSMSGGHLVGPSIIDVIGMMTVTGGSFDNDMNLHTLVGSVCELLNANDFVFTGGSNGTGNFTNAGTLNVHGAGSLRGISDFRNHGTVNWQMPLLSSEAAALALQPTPRVITAITFHDAGKVGAQQLISQDGASLIGQDGASLIGQDGASLISQDGGSLIGQDGASLIGQDGASLIGQDGASLIGQDGASLIGEDGASLIGQDGASLIGQDGASFAGSNGGVFKVTPNGASAARTRGTAVETGYFKEGGELDLNNLAIIGPVSMSGGVLSGNGVIDGSLTNTGGYISPGHSPGSIKVTGNFEQGSNGTLIFEAAGAEPGTFDRLQVGGTAALGGKLDFRTINGYVPLPNDPVNPIGYGAVTGGFGAVSGNASLTFNSDGVLAVLDPNTPNPPPGVPVNIATRVNVLNGDNVLISGFIVTGPSGSTKKVLIRGLGPSLSGAGLANVLIDPLLEFHNPDGSTTTNDNWNDAPNKDQLPSGLQPANEKEAIIIADLAPGGYTVIEKGAHGETGNGLCEVYDLDEGSAAMLANVSTRGFVDTDDNVMIGGIILGGNEPTKILVRAIGPSLAALNVPNPLADPVLELHDQDGNAVGNDNWRDTQEAEINATGLAPSANEESAILITLPPGGYTAIVRGKDSGTGVGLVEAFKVQ